MSRGSLSLIEQRGVGTGYPDILDAPSLEQFKVRLDGTLNTLV